MGEQGTVELMVDLWVICSRPTRVFNNGKKVLEAGKLGC